ncbi:hypothetical protein ADL01_24045 [Streptomyces sp. NRRL WC-3618]|uniref:hypothetical protein n=1 Tax=Streptomyces sp. NRRL WC-3618 TaxID=1519490 RepID=UPI0006AFE55A|nr:hypothetical protein [Streptomyces sp. NRRL WC-3618]KOV68056.1 hypothetical protein ADL01_24045 [Streptomyces sp. NRRL WC-3618]
MIQYIDGYPGGAAGFVTRANELADRYGDRFRLPLCAAVGRRIWDPDELLQLILVIATYWASASGSSAESPSHYRGVAEEAVRRLIEPKR